MDRKKTDLVQLSVRLKEDVRRKIEREAKKRDISLNDEVVRLIERGYENERTFGSEWNQVLLKFLAAAMTMAERGTGKQWNENADGIKKALNWLIDYAADLAGTKADERADDAKSKAHEQGISGVDDLVEIVAGEPELLRRTDRDVFRQAVKR
jgi:hypothetical protein